MTNEEKLQLLEEILELPEGELREDILLDDLEEWDSMARLSLIVLMEDEFGKKITRSEVMNYKTIQDILQTMN